MQMHRDRRRDAVQATRDALPRSGRPERPSGCGVRLGRGKMPALRLSSCQRTAQGDHGCIGAGGHVPAYSTTISGWSYSTGWPFWTITALTVPARGAGIAFITFIASTISSVCPADTLSPTDAKFFAPGSADR